LTLPRIQGREPDSEAQRRECTSMTTRSFALARICRHREALLKPRIPARFLVGGGFGRLIAVKVEVQGDHARATAVEGAEGGDARPRRVEPKEGVVRTLAVVLRHAAERRDAGTPAGAVHRCPTLTPFTPTAAVSDSQASASVPATGTTNCMIVERWPRKWVR